MLDSFHPKHFTVHTTMARLAATAVLLLCLLAVASCRVIEVEPDTVFAISDEQSETDPAVP